MTTIREFRNSNGWLVNAVKQYRRQEVESFSNGESLLHTVAKEGNALLCRHLLEMGYNPNAIDICGHTPLYSAIQARNIETIVSLIDGGSDVNHRSYDKNTPLIAAIAVGDLDIIRVLVENGADVNIKNRFGETPAYLADCERKIKIGVLLRKYGAESYSEGLS